MLGTKKTWGVYAWVGNVPQKSRLSHRDKGRAILLGYLPNVRSKNDLFNQLTHQQVPGKNGDDSSALALHRVHVYHRGLELIFKSVKDAAKYGAYINAGFEQPLDAVFAVVAASYDYEEA